MEQFLVVGEHSSQGFLGGKVLVATPALDDSIFERSLIYICSQDQEGAIGVIFNKPDKYITEEEVIEITGARKTKLLNRKFQIFIGGPIEDQKLFILSATREQKKFFDNDPSLTMYTNAEQFLLDKIKGRNHDTFLVARGYCGWAYGQLEAEVEENSWMVIKPDFKMIFSGNPKNKWEKAIHKAGIRNIQNFKDLVSYTGNA